MSTAHGPRQNATRIVTAAPPGTHPARSPARRRRSSRRWLTDPRSPLNKDLIAQRGQVLAAYGRRSAIGAPHRSPNRSAIRGWPASGEHEWPTSGERRRSRSARSSAASPSCCSVARRRRALVQPVRAGRPDHRAVGHPTLADLPAASGLTRPRPAVTDRRTPPPPASGPRPGAPLGARACPVAAARGARAARGPGGRRRVRPAPRASRPMPAAR